MRDSQCNCTSCAQDLDAISKVPAEFSEVFVLHTSTTASEALGLCEGEECEQDHDHEASRSCSLMYKCDECDTAHEYMTDAEECCAGWECNYCGYTHHASYYSTAREKAAQCCVQACDECNAVGWPDFIETHDCNSGHGMRRQLPWEARGVVVDGRTPDLQWKDTWSLNPEKYNVVQAAADYYLLTALSWGIVGTTTPEGVTDNRLVETTNMQVIMSEAKSMLDELVAEWDPILQAYTHMAVGGELRHHKAVGGEVLSADRDQAWSGWKTIFEVVGPDALIDANELFLEFTGGSFGGKPWGDACLILHARLTDKITPQMFLDRIFNAQHNGGCLLNKVEWKGDKLRRKGDKDGMSLSDLTHIVLPAHGAEPVPQYAALLAYASTPVRALFSDSFVQAGHAAKLLGLPVLTTRAPRPRRMMTTCQEAAYNTAKWMAAEKAQANKSYAEKAWDMVVKYAKYVDQYEVYAKDEIESNAKNKAAYGDEYYLETYYQCALQDYKAQLADWKAEYNTHAAAEAVAV